MLMRQDLRKQIAKNSSPIPPSKLWSPHDVTFLRRFSDLLDLANFLSQVAITPAALSNRVFMDALELLKILGHRLSEVSNRS